MAREGRVEEGVGDEDVVDSKHGANVAAGTVCGQRKTPGAAECRASADTGPRRVGWGYGGAAPSRPPPPGEEGWFQRGSALEDAEDFAELEGVLSASGARRVITP